MTRTTRQNQLRPIGCIGGHPAAKTHSHPCGAVRGASAANSSPAFLTSPTLLIVADTRCRSLQNGGVPVSLPYASGSAMAPAYPEKERKGLKKEADILPEGALGTVGVF